MAVEFALRPRIRLREDPAPARRVRPRLPKFALPALTYWLVIGGLVYEFVHHHDPGPPPPVAEAALAPLAPASPPVLRQWWRPLPAPVTPEPPRAIAEPTTPEPEVQSAPLTDPTPPPEAAPEAVPKAEVAPEAEAPFPNPARTLPPAAARRLAFRPTRTLAPALVPQLNPVDEPSLLEPPARTIPPKALRAPAPSEAASAPVSSSLPSCESALVSASQDVDFSGGNRAADLPTQAIAAVLENGAWLASCAVPEHTALDVCVAIKGGRVVGASVTSRPADSALNACVKRRASSLQFPYSPHVDLARTRF